MNKTYSVILALGWPIIERTIVKISEDYINEENMKELHDKILAGAAKIVDRIPTQIDNMLLDELKEAFENNYELVQKYGDRILDPIENYIKASANKYDDLALPAIAQFRIVTNIPDND